MSVQVRLSNPRLVAAAADDARLLVRTPGNTAVNFFVIGDELVATVTAAQAAHFASIEGYVVDGYEPVKRAPAPITNWFDEGDRLKSEKDGVLAKTVTADPLAALAALMGGPEALMKMLAANLGAKSEDIAQMAARDEAARLQAEEDYERTRDWNIGDARKLADEQLAELMQEFLPHVDTSNISTLGMAANLASLANTNTLLNSTFVNLLGNMTAKSRQLGLQASQAAPKPTISQKAAAAAKPAVKKPAAKPRTPAKKK